MVPFPFLLFFIILISSSSSNFPPKDLGCLRCFSNVDAKFLKAARERMFMAGANAALNELDDDEIDQIWQIIIQFCEIGRSMFQCLEKCRLPLETWRELDLNKLKKLFIRLFEVVCVDYWTDIMNELKPCLSKHERSITSRCKPQCKPYKPKGNLAIWKAKYKTMTKIEAWKFADNLVANACRYQGCFVECRVSMLMSLCSDKAAQIEEAMSLEIFDAMEVLYSELKKFDGNQSNFKLNCRYHAEFYDDVDMEHDEL